MATGIQLGRIGVVGASLLASGTCAVVLAPLIPIAAGFHELARSIESDADFALTVFLHGLPLDGAVVCGVLCLRTSDAGLAMARGAYSTAAAVVVLLLASLSVFNRSKTLMMEAAWTARARAADADESLFETVLAASRSLDDLVPAAFGICGLGVVVFTLAGRRFSRK